MFNTLFKCNNIVEIVFLYAKNKRFMTNALFFQRLQMLDDKAVITVYLWPFHLKQAPSVACDWFVSESRSNQLSSTSTLSGDIKHQDGSIVNPRGSIAAAKIKTKQP